MRNLLSILLVSVVLPGTNCAVARTAPATQYEVLTLLRSRQNHLRVNALINGKPASLIVDTGSPATVIASDRRAYFGLTGIAPNGGLPKRVDVNGAFNRLAMVHSLQLGVLNVVDVPAILANLFQLRRASHRQYEKSADGILGADILLETKAILDCQQQVLILNMYPKLSGRPPNVDFRGFQKMPVYVSDGLNLYVDTSINGMAARLMVDTGAFVTLLHRPFVRGMRIPFQETGIQSSALNLKEDDVDVARVQRLSVGLVDIVDKRVGVTDLGGVIRDGLQDSPPVVGLLGAEFLRRQHGIIDFGTRTLYLKGSVAPANEEDGRGTKSRARIRSARDSRAQPVAN